MCAEGARERERARQTDRQTDRHTLRGTRSSDRHLRGEHARGGGGSHSHSRLVDTHSFAHVLLYLLQGVGFGGIRLTVVPTASMKSVTRILCMLARSSLARSLSRARALSLARVLSLLPD